MCKWHEGVVSEIWESECGSVGFYMGDMPPFEECPYCGEPIEYVKEISFMEDDEWAIICSD